MISFGLCLKNGAQAFYEVKACKISSVMWEGVFCPILSLCAPITPNPPVCRALSYKDVAALGSMQTIGNEAAAFSSELSLPIFLLCIELSDVGPPETWGPEVFAWVIAYRKMRNDWCSGGNLAALDQQELGKVHIKNCLCVHK